MDSQYFSALMIPDPQIAATYRLTETPQANAAPDITVIAPTETASLIVPGFYLSPQHKQANDFRLYVGPKDDTILKTIKAPNAPETSETPLNLSKVIDFGFFGVIAWGMLWVFKGVHSVFGNYGISIILLTALVKVFSYPFTHKAHKSMKKMQKLQPQLLELKEKYRDDPQKNSTAQQCASIKRTVSIRSAGASRGSHKSRSFGHSSHSWEARSSYAAHLSCSGLMTSPHPIRSSILPFTIPLIITQIDAIRLLPIINGLTTWLQQKFRRKYGTGNRQHANEVDAIHAPHLHLYLL